MVLSNCCWLFGRFRCVCELVLLFMLEDLFSVIIIILVWVVVCLVVVKLVCELVIMLVFLVYSSLLLIFFMCVARLLCSVIMLGRCCVLFQVFCILLVLLVSGLIRVSFFMLVDSGSIGDWLWLLFFSSMNDFLVVWCVSGWCVFIVWVILVLCVQGCLNRFSVNFICSMWCIVLLIVVMESLFFFSSFGIWVLQKWFIMFIFMLVFSVFFVVVVVFSVMLWWVSFMIVVQLFIMKLLKFYFLCRILFIRYGLVVVGMLLSVLNEFIIVVVFVFIVVLYGGRQIWCRWMLDMLVVLYLCLVLVVLQVVKCLIEVVMFLGLDRLVFWQLWMQVCVIVEFRQVFLFVFLVE